MNNSISYAITVCNEVEEIKKLIQVLSEGIRSVDEIVVLYDKKNGTSDVRDFLIIAKEAGIVEFYEAEFSNHFANWKNLLTEYCGKDFIFQIDADEVPDWYLLQYLPILLEANPDNEVYLVPRVNTVQGLTQKHISEWGWQVNKEGWVNWPDYQWRIWKNVPDIKWINRVHERLEGFKTYSLLPQEKEFSLYHPKTIERQEKQNAYYDTL